VSEQTPFNPRLHLRVETTRPDRWGRVPPSYTLADVEALRDEYRLPPTKQGELTYYQEALGVTVQDAGAESKNYFEPG